MRNVLAFLVFALTVFSCQSAKDEYSIKGSIAGVETGKVYLQKIVDGQPRSIDSAKLVGGKFAFNGKMEIPDIRLLRLNQQEYFAQFFLDNAKYYGYSKQRQPGQYKSYGVSNSRYL